MCVCVCVSERERESERETLRPFDRGARLHIMNDDNNIISSKDKLLEQQQHQLQQHHDEVDVNDEDQRQQRRQQTEQRQQQHRRHSPPLADVYVGTAGYSYPHWRSSSSSSASNRKNNVAFYPKNVIHKHEFLRYYSGIFPTVEINSSFHGVPRLETLEGWKHTVKDGFLFAFKVPQIITHDKRLTNIDDSLLFFLNRLYDGFFKKNKEENSKETLEGVGDDEKEDTGGGCNGEAIPTTTTTTATVVIVLFQLPPSLSRDLSKLDSIGKIIRCFEEDHYNRDGDVQKFRYVFEFRHKSWYTQDVYDKLTQFGFALCENISPDNSTNHVSLVTATTATARGRKFHYIRCHKLLGDEEGKFETNYTDTMLSKIADSIVTKRFEGITVYCYFLNDHGGHGPKNAKTLMKYIQEKSSSSLDAVSLISSESESKAVSTAVVATTNSSSAAPASSLVTSQQQGGNQDPRRLVHNWKPDPTATSISSMFAKQIKQQQQGASTNSGSGSGSGSGGSNNKLRNLSSPSPSSKSSTATGTKRDIRTAFLKQGSPPSTKKSATTTTRTTTRTCSTSISSSTAKKQKNEHGGGRPTTTTKPGTTLHTFFSPKTKDDDRPN